MIIMFRSYIEVFEGLTAWVLLSVILPFVNVRCFCCAMEDCVMPQTTGLDPSEAFGLLVPS